MTTPKCISMDRLAKQQSSQETCCKTIACYNIFFKGDGEKVGRGRGGMGWGEKAS